MWCPIPARLKARQPVHLVRTAERTKRRPNRQPDRHEKIKDTSYVYITYSLASNTKVATGKNSLSAPSVNVEFGGSASVEGSRQQLDSRWVRRF